MSSTCTHCSISTSWLSYIKWSPWLQHDHTGEIEVDLFWAKDVENVVFDGGIPQGGQNELLSATVHVTQNRSRDTQVIAVMASHDTQKIT